MKTLAGVCIISSVLFINACKSSKPQTAVQNTVSQNETPSQETVAPVGLNFGNTAPEIVMPGLSGQPTALSSLKGKVVLIDFWASWCTPCRQENPSLVKAYQRFKDKKFRGGNGFTIFSVSLDANAQAWKRAIELDSLNWEFHASDLRGWGNEAATRYGVSAIPANFLINEKGIIINKNLSGENLIKFLEKLAL